MAPCDLNSDWIKVAFNFVTLEIILLLAVSNVLHFFLQRLGQPSIISQFLAGIIAGKTVLWRMSIFRDRSGGFENYFADVVLTCRFVFMFLIGLEVDIVYLRQNIHRSASIALASIAACISLAFATCPLLFGQLAYGNANTSLFVLTFGLFLANTASPVLICIVTELKLASSNIGKLAISCAVVNDLTAVVAYALYSIEKSSADRPVKGFLGRVLFLTLWGIMVAVAMLVMKWLVKFLNAWNRKKRYISIVEVCFLLAVVRAIGFGLDYIGYNSMPLSFLLGLAMQREGPTARTMLEKLMFPVHYIILPLYFSGVFVKQDLHNLFGKNAGKTIGIAFLISTLSIVGKVAGTVAVTRFFLKMRLREGVVLGILLNAKGYMDIVFIAIGINFQVWGLQTAMLLIFTVMINTVIACPVARLIVSWERKAYRYNSQSLEHLEPQRQIRILACVHGQREVPGMLTLSSLCAGDGWSLIAIYLMHLVELTQKYTVTLMYNQRSSHGGSGWDSDNDDLKQVSSAADTFSQDTGLLIRQLTAVSSYRSMHEDVCMSAEEVRACVVLLPFHKEQRYDRRMVCRRDEKRQLNLKVIQHIPCTVGILVDRPLGGGMSIGMPSTSASLRTAARTSAETSDPETPAPVTPTGPVHKVVAIFFGGPDDREAASFLARIAPHASVNATLVRFMPDSDEDQSKTWSSRCMSEFALITERDMQLDIDEQFITGYQQRYVESGIVTYTERCVSSGPETVDALSSMAGMYSLFIVGKGGPHLSTMMMGIRDWEECPELGPIGDLLASEDFMDSGSVLIMQQHKVSRNKLRIDEDILT